MSCYRKENQAHTRKNAVVSTCDERRHFTCWRALFTVSWMILLSWSGSSWCKLSTNDDASEHCYRLPNTTLFSPLAHAVTPLRHVVGVAGAAFGQVPRLVSLLAESFNAHMRFGSCLAIGISCAGTGSREAMDVLEPMMEDVVDFVRQVQIYQTKTWHVLAYSGRTGCGLRQIQAVAEFDLLFSV